MSVHPRRFHFLTAGLWVRRCWNAPVAGNVAQYLKAARAPPSGHAGAFLESSLPGWRQFLRPRIKKLLVCIVSFFTKGYLVL